MQIVRRHLKIDLPPDRSAFLWGPRKVGKTYWLHQHFLTADDRVIDLLETDTFAEYAARPALLRERWDGRRTVIDEVQKVPALLDEVHWLIAHRQASFLLTGSSARKLRREHANLLAGRAWRYEMGPLSATEVTGFDLERAMWTGLIPPHALSPDPDQDLRAYVADYLKEEIAAEAQVRNIPAFADFLRVAAITSSELISYTNVAREVGVSARVVRGYFEILDDTLLGQRLAPWARSADRRMIQTEKFYLFDVGVANHLARRRPKIGGADFGKSFEHWVLMEILNYRRYRDPDLDVRFWRTSTGMEVDFILGDMAAAIEVKATARVTDAHLRGLRALSEGHRVRRSVVVSLEKEPRTLSPGITVLPWSRFLDELWSGELTQG
ncbi:MAG: ATP-binding protein [Ardenticatenia bacterium]|nr:ATP-binding protein [Ardenticatenia bacterium]